MRVFSFIRFYVFHFHKLIFSFFDSLKFFIKIINAEVDTLRMSFAFSFFLFTFIRGPPFFSNVEKCLKGDK